MADEKQKEITRFVELQDEFNKMLLLADDGVLKLLIATVVANQMDGDPVWMFLVASSSGGKSELITTLNTIQIGEHNLIFPISDLTTNTFASGQKKTGKEKPLTLFEKRKRKKEFQKKFRK